MLPWGGGARKSRLFDRSYLTSDDLGPGAYRVLSHINGSSSTVAGSVAGRKAKGRNVAKVRNVAWCERGATVSMWTLRSHVGGCRVVSRD